MKDKVVVAYQIDELGVHLPDYFQGYGVSHTEYTDCATGIGDTPEEALEDALEMLAQSGWDTSLITDKVNTGPSLAEEDEKEREAEREQALQQWIEDQKEEGKVHIDEASDEDCENGNTFNPDDFEWENDDEENYNDQNYYVGIRVRAYDPEKDDEVTGQIAEAVGRLSDLYIKIHNAVVKLNWTGNLHVRGSKRRNHRRYLARMRRERDRLEAFVAANYEGGLYIEPSLSR